MIRNITIVGIGRMGKTVALASALAGYNVTLRSRRGIAGYNDFTAFLHEQIVKGRVSSDELKVLSKVAWTEDIISAVKKADIVIECVREDELEKKELFSQLDKICPEQVVLASNTSSLSIGELSILSQNPQRIIGLHFFNPANVMKLVEIIPTEKTSKRIVENSVLFVKSLGKIPIITNDTTGFVVNRILFTMINEAIFCLMEKGGDAETIDAALKLGANFPMGPLALSDFIGLDTCLQVLENLYKHTGKEAYNPCPLLRAQVAKGNLGRKTGRGFFVYDQDLKNQKCKLSSNTRTSGFQNK
jgi:3-hydroxybutyryl-CoA dehydrogenase